MAQDKRSGSKGLQDGDDGGSSLLPHSFVVEFNRLWLWILGPLLGQCITTDYSYLTTNDTSQNECVQLSL